jgi:4-hydroxy-3-methylbut-2-enyl diphosphate reductase
MSDDRIASQDEAVEPVEGEARTATATDHGHEPVQEQVAAPEETTGQVEHAQENVPAAAEPVSESAAAQPAEPETTTTEQPAMTGEAEEPAKQAAAKPGSPQGKPSELDAAAEFEAALEAFEGGTTGTAYDEAYRPLRRGELITARVIQVDKDKVFVDLGTKSEGVVPLDELSANSFENPADVVKVGDEIQVVVLNPEGREGNPVVSKKRAEFEAVWDRIVEEYEQKVTVNAIISERVKGGLVVDLGVRGFVPATHVGSGQIRNLDKFVGRSLPFKIIEVDRDRRKVVLSNRLAEEETREERKAKLFDTVKPGDVMEGHVRRIVEYGAFIDLGGVDGLLHVSEMSWSRVEHPKEVIHEGEDIKVMVLRLDPGSGRISLGRRQVLPDPWTSFRENYSVGQRLTLPISRIVQSGAFVKLPEGAEAFIPMSEMSHRRINKPQEAVETGQEVEVQVIDLRPDERRLVLSMRALLPYEEQQGRSEEAKHRGERSRDRRGSSRSESRGHQSAPTGNLTIGERLSALKGLNFGDDESEEPAADEPKDQPEE